jgi:hypothetical protein
MTSQGEKREPTEGWEWYRSGPADGEHGTHAQLARYVSAEAVRALGLVTWREEGDDDVAVAKRLYELLQSRRVGYSLEGFLHKHGAQPIRDPWLLLKNEVGTCIDFATTFAAMCLEAAVRPLLGVTDGHAFVVLVPGSMSAEPEPLGPLQLDGFTNKNGEHEGVLRADVAAVRSAIDSRRLIAIDSTFARRDGPDFATAESAGRSQAEEANLFVDLLYLQYQRPFYPLVPPDGHEPIHRLVPADDDDFEEYEEHARIKEQLAGATGLVVLWGRQGQGKSRLARELARRRRAGGGWYLDASGPQALLTSLAAADLAGRGESVAGRARLDREGYAYNALRLLSESEAPWILVLDNADGDPALIEHLTPTPAAGQLVLVTSTNPAWKNLPAVTSFLELPRVPDSQLAASDLAPLMELIDGRPLVRRAFERLLLGAADLDAAAVAGMTPADDKRGLRAQLTMWNALREVRGFGETELFVSACSAFLPPDRQPLAAFRTLAGVLGEAAARYLADRGLLSWELQMDAEDSSSLRLHRSFGAAIRLDLEEREAELCDRVCLAIAGEPKLRDLLDVYGDLDTVGRLADRLKRLDDPAVPADVSLGLALHGTGALLELQGQTPRSGVLFELAERHLEDGEHPKELADCQRGRARTVNQHHQKDEALLREAVGLARSARVLLESAGEGGEHCRAMEGLLLEKLSAFPGEGEDEVNLLKAALAVIEMADERRRGDESIDPAELARSEFNRAGPRIRLAQKEAVLAPEHLDLAMTIYESVRRQRERIYRRPVHPHIAACVIGEGYVGYYRAMLLDADHAQRTRWLREATDRSARALEQRSWLEGSIDLDEVQKAASFMTKVLLARVSAPVATSSRHESVYNAAMAELEKAGIALPRVPLVPAGARAEIAAGIQQWVDSSALRAVVREFGAEVPAGSLAIQLEWLDEFSAMHWDFRAGKERNLAAAPQMKPETERVAVAAAESLGLIGSEEPERRSASAEDRARSEHVLFVGECEDEPVRYEHVLILGGLVRACLARPLHAAKLLREGAIEAGSVTALGGFREIAGDEIGLVEKVTGEEVDDEFHAMDAGVRNAFGLTEAASERGEDSEVLGASWRVREYAAGNLPVRVVAAPSMAPRERRANTPDTYAWFATELAELTPGERVLVVTTEIYVPYQHADAIRMLALPYGVVVDTVGVMPGNAHPDLRQTFGADKYLQELRSTIRAYRALNDAL